MWSKWARTTGQAARAASQGPLESLDSAEEAATFVAGGLETVRPLLVGTPALEGALYSSRGRGYAPYNEDGAVLFAGSDGRLYGAVFDQAGGLGGSVRGAGSRVGAVRTTEAFVRISTGERSPDAISRELGDALEQTHQELLTRGEGEVTTAVVAVALPDGEVMLASSGDSAGLLFDPSGHVVAQSVLHQPKLPHLRGCLTHALGLRGPGPDVQHARWRLEPGSSLVLCTDGLLDAELELDEIGACMRAEQQLGPAVDGLVRRVLRRMRWYQGKPDNLTLLAVRRNEKSPAQET